MTTPTLNPFHQKIFTHAKSAKRNRFSALSFLKFRIPHFAFPNKILPFPLNSLTPRRPTAAFTLIELLAVITIIGILAGLTLGAAGAVRRHGANSTAKAEVAALQAACDRYYADYSAYPIGTASPTTVTEPAKATALFSNLVGSDKFSAAPTTKRYFEPKPAMVETNKPPNSPTTSSTPGATPTVTILMARTPHSSGPPQAKQQQVVQISGSPAGQKCKYIVISILYIYKHFLIFTL